MEWVLAHMEDSDFNEPLPDPAAAAAAEGGISGGSQGVGSGAGGANPEAVAQLAAMGFDDAQAGAALQVGISEHGNRQYTDAYTDACGCAVPCQAACRSLRGFLVLQLAAGSSRSSSSMASWAGMHRHDTRRWQIKWTKSQCRLSGDAGVQRQPRAGGRLVVQPCRRSGQRCCRRALRSQRLSRYHVPQASHACFSLR